jgi:hypothetical protein
MEPPCNIQTWIINYIVIPSYNMVLRTFAYSVAPGLIGGGATQTFVNPIAPAINTTGAGKFAVVLTGLRAVMNDTRNKLSVALTASVFNTTSIQIVLKNLANITIDYQSCLMAGIYYN